MERREDRALPGAQAIGSARSARHDQAGEPTHNAAHIEPKSGATSREHEDFASLAERSFAGDREALALIALCAESGDPEAWACLERHVRRLTASIARHGAVRVDAAAVDDLSQMATAELLALFRAGRFDSERATQVSGLISVIASRLIGRFVRRQTRERAATAAAMQERLRADVDQTISLADEVYSETGYDRKTFDDVLSQLPEPERSAVLLHARGLPLDRIAEHIGYRGRSGAHRALKRGLRMLLVGLEARSHANGGGGAAKKKAAPP